MEDSVVICPESEQFIVEILNRDSSAVEVMEPYDYKVVTVALPYDDDPGLKSIRVLHTGQVVSGAVKEDLK